MGFRYNLFQSIYNDPGKNSLLILVISLSQPQSALLLLRLYIAMAASSQPLIKTFHSQTPGRSMYQKTLPSPLHLGRTSPTTMPLQQRLVVSKLWFHLAMECLSSSTVVWVFPSTKAKSTKQPFSTLPPRVGPLSIVLASFKLVNTKQSSTQPAEFGSGVESGKFFENQRTPYSRR